MKMIRFGNQNRLFHQRNIFPYVTQKWQKWQLLFIINAHGIGLTEEI